MLCCHIIKERPVSLYWVLNESICMSPYFSKNTCQSTCISLEETRKGNPSFLIHIGLLLAALSTGWCTQQIIWRVLPCPVCSRLQHHCTFISLSVMLLQEILVSDMKGKKKEKRKKKYKYLHWHKWEIWGNGPLYGSEKTYWAGFTNEEAVKWNDTFGLFIA